MSQIDDDNSYEKVGELVSIFQRGQTWYANFQFEGKQRRQSLKTVSKKEARRRALQLERDLAVGQYTRPQRAPLIEDVIRQHSLHLESEGREKKTIAKYEFAFKVLLEVAQRQNKLRISQVDLALVDAFRAERTAGNKERKPSKPKTVHHDTVAIRQLVNFAIKRGLIADDPLRNLKIRKPKRTLQPCWTREQVDLILEAAKPPHRVALFFLAETGCRVGEAKWLTWDDVIFDAQRGYVHIRPKPGWKPKSGDERVVPMSLKLRALLSAMPRTSKWVFTARVTPRHPQIGRQISERRLLEYLKRILKRLGLPGHLHTFRHSFISFAARKGISERVLRTWIGHVDQRILAWYFHLTDEQSHAEMRRLSRLSDGENVEPN